MSKIDEWSRYFSTWCELPASAILDLFDEIDRLNIRLEVYRRGDYSTDGIACRDETIKLLDQKVERLTAENKRLTVSLAGAKGSVERQHKDIKRLTVKNAELTHENESLCDLEMRFERLTAELEKVKESDELGWNAAEAKATENERLRAALETHMKEHQAGRKISRHSPNKTWSDWVVACDKVEALQGDSDE